MMPKRFIECWITAEASCEKEKADFQTIVVCSRTIWHRLASHAKLPADKAVLAAGQGQCNVQLSDMNPAPIMVFKILNSNEERITVIAIEPKK